MPNSVMIKDIRKVNLKSGDMLVIMVEGRLSDDHVDQIRQQLMATDTTQLTSIENKLDLLIAALGEEQDDEREPSYNLDGELLDDTERDGSQSLG